MTYVRIRLTQKSYDNIREILCAVEAISVAHRWNYTLLETFILEAVLSFAQSDSDSACEYMQKALNLSEGSGLTRVYADEGKPVIRILRRIQQKGIHVQQIGAILKVMGRIDSAQTECASGLLPDSAENLTTREMQILNMLCAGASNQEISRRLFLSLSTVKNYTHSIYGKLGVTSRTQALLKAREYGLISGIDE